MACQALLLPYLSWKSLRCFVSCHIHPKCATEYCQVMRMSVFTLIYLLYLFVLVALYHGVTSRYLVHFHTYRTNNGLLPLTNLLFFFMRFILYSKFVNNIFLAKSWWQWSNSSINSKTSILIMLRKHIHEPIISSLNSWSFSLYICISFQYYKCNGLRYNSIENHTYM